MGWFYLQVMGWVCLPSKLIQSLITVYIGVCNHLHLSTASLNYFQNGNCHLYSLICGQYLVTINFAQHQIDYIKSNVSSTIKFYYCNSFTCHLLRLLYEEFHGVRAGKVVWPTFVLQKKCQDCLSWYLTSQESFNSYYYRHGPQLWIMVIWLLQWQRGVRYFTLKKN